MAQTCFWKGCLELIHFVGRHEQGEQGPEVVVRGRSGEGAGLDVEPEVAKRRPLGEVAGDDAALGAEERLVGASGDDVGALGERFLESAVETKDMGHVEHDHRLLRPVLDDVGDELDGFLINEHALAEDHELGPVCFQQFSASF